MDILGNIILLIVGSIFAFISQKKLNNYTKQATLEIDIYLELIKLLDKYKTEVSKIYELCNKYFNQEANGKQIDKQDEEYLKRFLSEDKLPPHIFEIALLQQIIAKDSRQYDAMYSGSNSLFKMLGYRINNYSEYNQHETILYSDKTIENCYIKHQKSIELFLNEIQEILNNK